jgi:glycosyltransferase involved in cell wall biosynthesis
MRVLFIINSMSFGGAEKQVFDLLLGLKKKGVQVFLITLVKPTAFIEELKKNDINHYCINLKQKNKKNIIFHFVAFLNLFFVIKKFNPEIIHSHLFHSNMYGRVVSFFLNAKNISTVHSLVEYGKFRPILYRFTNWLCSKMVFVSEVSRLKYVENKATKKEKSLVINNGFNLDKNDVKKNTNTTELRKTYGFSIDNFIWIAVGRLIPTKDYLLLLESFLVLYKKDDNVRLLIVGKGQERHKMKKFIVNNSLDSVVVIINPIFDIDQIYLMADAYISTSQFESFGMTLVEAIIFNLPVLSTKNGGAEEILYNDKIGLLIDNRESSYISYLMLETMSNPKKNIAAYDNLKEKYNIENILDIWISLYLNTIKK